MMKFGLQLDGGREVFVQGTNMIGDIPHGMLVKAYYVDGVWFPCDIVVDSEYLMFELPRIREALKITRRGV